LVVMAGLLAACASAAVTPTAPPAATTPLPPDDTGSVQAAPLMGMGGRLYAAQDLSIIAATGRPQFLNAYADWWTTCNANQPIVNGLTADFGERIDFIHLNIDDPTTMPARERFGFNDRSQYALLDSAGNIVEKWFGPLNIDEVSAYLGNYLASL
jgi:thiol:disulfide interchange protein